MNSESAARHVLLKNVQLYPTKDCIRVSSSSVSGLCMPLRDPEPHPLLMKRIASGGLIKLVHPETGQQVLVPVQPYTMSNDEPVPTSELTGEDLNGLQKILTQHGQSDAIAQTKDDAMAQQRDVLMNYKLKKPARRGESNKAPTYVLLPAAHLQKYPNLNLTSVGTVMNGVNTHQLEIAHKNSVLRLSHLPDTQATIAPQLPSAPSSPNSSGAEDALDVIQDFVESFRQRRVDLGFTQGDLSEALQEMYGAVWSQTTLSRFEAMSLSYRNTSTIVAVLKRWLEDISRAVRRQEKRSVKREEAGEEDEEEEEGAVTSYRTVTLKATGRDEPLIVRYRQKSDDVVKRRRKRTKLSEDALQTLEAVYESSKMPTADKMRRLGECLSIPVEVVRSWFNNKRSRERRVHDIMNDSEIRARGSDILNINADELTIVPESADRRPI